MSSTAISVGVRSCEQTSFLCLIEPVWGLLHHMSSLSVLRILHCVHSDDGAALPLHPHFSVFLGSASLRWYFIMVLICTSLGIVDVGNVFIYFLAVCHLLKNISLDHLYILKLVCLLIYYCWNEFLDVSPSQMKSLQSMFSNSVLVLFASLMVSFTEYSFAFLCLCFWDLV